MSGNDMPYSAQIRRGDSTKEYRWRIEEFNGRPRVVGDHRVVGAERWSMVRNPDTLAELLSRTPR